MAVPMIDGMIIDQNVFMLRSLKGRSSTETEND